MDGRQYSLRSVIATLSLDQERVTLNFTYLSNLSTWEWSSIVPPVIQLREKDENSTRVQRHGPQTTASNCDAGS